MPHRWAALLLCVPAAAAADPVLSRSAPRGKDPRGHVKGKAKLEEFPYGDLISDTVAYCYNRIVEDTNCCLDKHFAPNVTRYIVNRRGTRWTCGRTCADHHKGRRGSDTVWVPDGATCTSPRILWVHGGSWMYGSPVTESYGQLASKIAKLSGAVVMMLDYPLAPIGNYSTILHATKRAMRWLAKADLIWKGCDGKDAPLFLAGDSSGGGTALSLTLTLKQEGGWSPAGITRSHPEALPGGQILAGAIFYSPWTNLRCDTPDYYYNAFARIVDTKSFKHLERGGNVYVGDLLFHGHPKENLDDFTANAETYIGGDPSLLADHIASPYFAGERELGGGGMPPLHFTVGASESILGDSLIFAQKAAAFGTEVHLDVYVGMWHDFPMYSEGCGSGNALWQAERALNRTAEFIRYMAKRRVQASKYGLLWPPAGSQPGFPHTSYIYDLSRNGTQEWFPPRFADLPLGGSFGGARASPCSFLAAAAAPGGQGWALPYLVVLPGLLLAAAAGAAAVSLPWRRLWRRGLCSGAWAPCRRRLAAHVPLLEA